MMLGTGVEPDPRIARGWFLPLAVQAHRPTAAGLLEAANQLAVGRVDPTLLDQVRRRIAHLLGNDATHARTVAADRADPLAEDDGRLLFAEQFVLDVTGVDPEAIGQLGFESFGQTRSFVLAVFLTEFMQRLELIATHLFEDPRDCPPDLALAAIDLPAQESVGAQQTWWDFQAAAQRGHALDPVTTEVVRLYCARTHNCRMCQTLRLADARAAGADDELTDKINFYERSDLAEHLKVALRIVDAFITRPDLLTEETVLRARVLFTEEQLAELCLDVLKWSSQKTLVSLGLDGADALPIGTDGMSFFEFGEDGQVSWSAATPHAPVG